MKKVLIITAVIVLIFPITSCKKDYTCKCTKTYTGSSTTISSDDGYYTYRDSRKRAEDRCDDNDRTGYDLGGDYTRNCDIQ